MKVLFLDIDGILNNYNHDSYRKNHFLPGRKTPTYCQLNVDAFNLITAAHPDVRIVISSSWRITNSLPKMRRYLRNWGVKGGRIIDFTPSLGLLRGRGLEIEKWIKEHPKVTSVVVLDDETVWEMVTNDIASIFVKASGWLGFCETDAQRAIDILNNPEQAYLKGLRDGK